MRPVVSFISAPAFSLSKRIDFWIKSRINHKSRFAIHSSLDLADKIKNVSPPAQASLISFDVTGLFPNLPNEPTLRHLVASLNDAHVPQFIIDEIMKLLKLCLKPNFCKFNSKTYVFPENIGVPMGYPLGSTLGEIFTDLLEETLFSLHPELTYLLVPFHG